jgi:translation initiation factor IF-1
MGKDKKNLIQGTIVEALPNTQFKVQIENGRIIVAHLAGKMRMFRIKILPGDKVTVETSEYDENRGRIVYRGR